ncbi:amidase [Chelatococcus asaccharovorans]|uniref:amidase n=1 Tax=Chelatococcus asaccharovorans TaxID=28210 RepID=UPI00224C768D|nr:amidase [Chelatococcus asaccharovorans]CAH1663232.1 Indole-3-acetamide hydrolase [Chelatococcus asaccharovorans]CAH1682912.1 Indole-3-acetamide hydrolase [Chelatococcus asaccharovorans]
MQREACSITTALSLGDRGPTLVVKECIAIAGMPTRSGSASLETSQPAACHADVVEAVLEAGCRIIGRANMHELAFGMTGVNAYLGTPINPRWPDRIPGGSSSGSAAAVAAGLCDFSIGTDTGGSIRQPATCCGVFALKPTFGRISRIGAMPAASSLDCIGPFARSAAMLTQAMTKMDRTFDPRLLRHAPKLRRIDVEAAPAIASALDIALAAACASGAMPRTRLEGLEDAYRAGLVIINRETAAAFEHLAIAATGIGADVRARILAAAKTTDAEVAEAECVRRHFCADVDRLLEDVDALVLPSMPVAPPTLEEARDPSAVLPLTRFLRPFNLSGHPSLVVPLVTAEGLPAGLQLVGRKGDDALLCAIAEWLAAD